MGRIESFALLCGKPWIPTSGLPRRPKKSPQDADSATCQALEAEVEAWVLPHAVDMLGEAVGHAPEYVWPGWC